jgi:hypothetical protein
MTIERQHDQATATLPRPLTGEERDHLRAFHRCSVREAAPYSMLRERCRAIADTLIAFGLAALETHVVRNNEREIVRVTPAGEAEIVRGRRAAG